jgi:hypothetical protein
MDIIPDIRHFIDNTDLKRQHPCSLLISHFNCPHVIEISDSFKDILVVYLTHPTCKFMVDNTFSNDRCFVIIEHFSGIFVKYNYPENLYENLLEMWEDFDTLNRRCITIRKTKFETTYTFCGDIQISAIDIEKNWKRQYRISPYINRNITIALGNMDEMISFIEVNYPECINPLQFIKPARI